MVRKSLPPGFRFHPTDVELVLYYLKRKIMGKKFHYEAIAEVNIYKHSPWDLPDKSSLKSKDLEWFFFCPREKKYASGLRVKRATDNGYWKTTGKDRNISCDAKIVGTVKTLVFHLGHAPRGERTDWVIHEYKILDDKLSNAGVQDNYVLCKVFKKNGLGPKNGAQYGAPFSEADWADDDDDVQNCAISLIAEGSCPTLLMQNEEQRLPPGSGLSGSENRPLNEGPSTSAVVPTIMVSADEATDGVTRLLASCLGEDMSLSNWNGLSQEDFSGNGQDTSLPSSEGMDLFSDLHDLDSWTDKMNKDIIDFSGVQNVDYSLNNILPEDNSNYIELDDLLSPLEGSNGVSGTHLSSLCSASASHSHENMQQPNSVNRIAGMDQFTFYANGDNSLDVLQMNDYQFNPRSHASSNLELPLGQLENADYSPDNMMERGSNLEREWILPARFPTAAALSLSCLYTCGGSSIHIKAEVTHRAGECTNEALSLMMEGSSSCWFHHSLVLQGLLLNFIHIASYFITIIIRIIRICCCLNLVNWSSFSIAPISVVSSLTLGDDHCSSHHYIDTFTNYSIFKVMSDIFSTRLEKQWSSL